MWRKFYRKKCIYKMRLMGIQVLLIFISRQGLKGWVKNRRIGTLFMGKLISDISVLYRIRLKMWNFFISQIRN